MPWVIGGFNGRLATSPDGQNWTLQTTPLVGNDEQKTIRDIAFGGGIFVAVAHEGQIIYSTDTENWTRIQPFSTTNYTDVIWWPDGAKFVAIQGGGGNSRGKILSSVDGINWVIEKTFPDSQPKGIHHDGSGLLFVCATSNIEAPLGHGRVFTSTDATNWIDRGKIQDQLLSEAHSDLGATTGGPILTIGGARPGFGDSTATIWISGDGITWTEQENHPFLFGVASIGFGNDVWVASSAAIVIAKSVDAQQWTSTSITWPFPSAFPVDLHYSETKALWVGVTQNGDIATSVDGENWTAETSPFTAIDDSPQAVMFGPADMVLVSAGQCPARFVPVIAEIFVVEKDLDTIELGVDLKISASRDDGTTFTEGTIEDVGDLDLTSGRRILRAIVLLTEQPSGAAMRWKIETLNLKSAEIHSVEMFWQ